MPFIRSAVKRGTQPAQKQAIVDGIHQALVDSIGMPPDELFNLMTEYEPEDFFYDRRFNGIARSDKLVVIEITMRRGRSDAMKKALYASHCRQPGEAGERPAGGCLHFHARERLLRLVRRQRPVRYGHCSAKRL